MTLQPSDPHAASASRERPDVADTPATWTFLSNHGHVLVCLARQSDTRLRDVADAVGITERAVQSIVADLEAVGAITRIRAGRRNRYEIHPQVHLRHPVEGHCTIGALLAMVGLTPTASRKPPRRRR